MSDLHDILAHSAQDSREQVWIEGSWVPRVPSVPIDSGANAVVRFAQRCWHQNQQMQLANFKADRKLAIAEAALRRLSERRLDKDVAIALAAIQAAREQL